MNRIDIPNPYTNKRFHANDRVVVTNKHSRHKGIEGTIFAILPDEGCFVLDVPTGSLKPSDRYKRAPYLKNRRANSC